MKNKPTPKYSPEVRQRAVRMVQEHRNEYPSDYRRSVGYFKQGVYYMNRFLCRISAWLKRQKGFFNFEHVIDRHYREESITVLGNIAGSSIFGSAIEAVVHNRITELSQILFCRRFFFMRSAYY